MLDGRQGGSTRISRCLYSCLTSLATPVNSGYRRHGYDCWVVRVVLLHAS